MESQPTLIILPDKTDETIETTPAKPSFWELIKIIVIFYVILGIVCYYFNKEWFNYLYVNPYNYIKGVTVTTQSK